MELRRQNNSKTTFYISSSGPEASRIILSHALWQKVYEPKLWKKKQIDAKPSRTLPILPTGRSMRWMAFIGQIRPLTSLTSGGKNRVWSQCRPHEEFCLPRSCVALHGHTSRRSGPGRSSLPSHRCRHADTLPHTWGLLKNQIDCRTAGFRHRNPINWRRTGQLTIAVTVDRCICIANTTTGSSQSKSSTCLLAARWTRRTGGFISPR